MKHVHLCVYHTFIGNYFMLKDCGDKRHHGDTCELS